MKLLYFSSSLKSHIFLKKNPFKDWKKLNILNPLGSHHPTFKKKVTPKVTPKLIHSAYF
jgi:hypothetical protein